MKPKKVLVTGGNGHVGNTLAKALSERGYDVRVTVRNPDEVRSAEIFAGYPIELYQADIRNEAAIAKAMHGVVACSKWPRSTTTTSRARAKASLQTTQRVVRRCCGRRALAASNVSYSRAASPLSDSVELRNSR